MGVFTGISAGLTWVRQRWLLACGLVFAVGLLGYRLSSVPTPGQLSRGEYSLAQTGGNWHHLLHEPFFLPYRGLAWLSRQVVPMHPTVAVRLPSVIVVLVALGAIAYILRHWYGPRTTLFGFIIISTSAALLHVGRLATVDVVYFVVLPLLLMAHLALQRSPGPKSLFGWLFTSVVLLYVPGAVWLVLLQIIWQRQLLGEAFTKLTSWFLQLAAVLVSTLALVPLGYGFFKHLNITYVLHWLGLPSSLPTLTQIAKNVAASLLFIFFRTPRDPSLWLGTLPLLGAFMLVCFVAGCFFYGSHLRAERTRLLVSITTISYLLLAAGGPVVRSIVVPLIYIVSFGGLAYLLHYWLSMFPRNITARWLGIGIVCVAIGLTVAYNLRHYFVAWPHNPSTRASFTYKPPK